MTTLHTCPSPFSGMPRNNISNLPTLQASFWIARNCLGSIVTKNVFIAKVANMMDNIQDFQSSDIDLDLALINY
jgi:hypothetical protein